MSGVNFGKFGEKFGKAGDARREDVVAFLRRRHPARTADLVSAEIGISADTIRKWIDGASAPSFRACFRMIAVYGPEFVAQVAPGLTWIGDAARAERQRALEDAIELQQRQLAQLKAERA